MFTTQEKTKWNSVTTTLAALEEVTCKDADHVPCQFYICKDAMDLIESGGKPYMSADPSNCDEKDFIIETYLQDETYVKGRGLLLQLCDDKKHPECIKSLWTYKSCLYGYSYFTYHRYISQEEAAEKIGSILRTLIEIENRLPIITKGVRCIKRGEEGTKYTVKDSINVITNLFRQSGPIRFSSRSDRRAS